MKHRKASNNTVTLQLLIAQFGTEFLIPIEEIANTILGMSIATVKRKAKNNELPFPTIRMLDSQKSPYCVHIEDLAGYVEDKCSKARIEWQRLQIAA